ncbi:choice-of-anchor M domain-containing protein [Labedella endophytica]|uniref:Bacterial Ig-like domain-containing protein n=1 Tax=Labedella endophytica TaxID=1523160 RepID=A0A433JWR3_9MICO|nr:choice-of-anchor M domain-containing protein [Labedella endophytica]RUR03549.1 hypothetical protein ELQ94_03195 [Labedella endophytica]
MNTRPSARLAFAGAATLAVSLVTPSAAMAIEGPPPPTVDTTVLSKLHTDAVSTFWTDGRFELATAADLPEGTGVRLDPASVAFDIDDAAKTVVPEGYGFIGTAGEEMWLAPETATSEGDGYATLWPGFSTESVPAGVLVDDETTFTLEGVEGPGDLEVYTGGGVGGVERLWSSDEGLSSFTIARSHMHANWAFTAPGTYTLDVRADARTAGGAVSATTAYTFVVGGVAPATSTGTTLSATPGRVALGSTVSLSSRVTPAAATGWVEFFDGTRSLGHDVVQDGRAALDVADLPFGTRQLKAVFTPERSADFSTSSSNPAPVTVVEDLDGVDFGIEGLATSYVAGEMIDLRAVGVTPKDGERLWWLIREGEGEGDYAMSDADGTLFGDRLTRDATTALDGAQIAVGLIDEDYRTIQESGWTTIRVTGENVGSGESMTISGLESSYYIGDPIELDVSHRALRDGESLRWVSRGLPYSTTWAELWEDQIPRGDGPYAMDTGALLYAEAALQIVDADGGVVGQTAAIRPELLERELQVSGVRSVYRAGDTLGATSDLFPAREGVAYQWLIQRGWEQEAIEGATDPSVELGVTADLDGAELVLRATDARTGFLIAQTATVVRVTDAAPGEQIVLLESLAGHYHQGNTVKLRASADPIASDTDTYRWLWQRPDQDGFTEIAGVTTAAHDVRAQQALDGTQVMVEFVSSAGVVLATSETVTIHVDDHGAAPQEKLSIAGLADTYAAGDEIALDATVTPDSVLQRWEWLLQSPGEDAPTAIAGQNTPELRMTATEDLDGASIAARLVFDDGETYIESTPVTLAVTPAAEQPAEPAPPIPGEPDPSLPGDADPSPAPPAEGDNGPGDAPGTDDAAAPEADGTDRTDGLAVTGSDVLGLLALVLAALLAGAAAIVADRRHRAKRS